MWSGSRGCRLRSRSNRRRRRGTRVRPSGRLRKSTTTCACCGRAWACPYSPATGLPIESQTVSQMVDKAMAFGDGAKFHLLAPMIRGRKGEYRKEFADLLKRGFARVKVDGEYLRAGRSAEARQEAEARHRRGGGPHRDPRRAGAASGGELRGGAGPGGRHCGGGVRGQGPGDERTAPGDVLGEVRLPCVRLHDPGDRAAAVLVQQPVRRVPGVRWSWRAAEDRSGAGRAGDGQEPERWRDCAVGQVGLAAAGPDAEGAGEEVQVLGDRAVVEAAGSGAERHPVRHGRGRSRLRV